MARRSISALEDEISRKIGVVLPDGRIYRNGVITSAADAAMSAATRNRDQALTMQTAGFRASQEASSPEIARLPQAAQNYFLQPAAQNGVVPATPAARAPLATFSPEEDFAASQLLRDAQTRKLLPDRNYSDQALARATPVQRIAEAKLLPQRLANRANTVALSGMAGLAAPAAVQTKMANQADALIPGTEIKAPAGAAIYRGADGSIVAQGSDGVVNRFNPSDLGAISQWAESQAPAASQATLASPDLATRMAAVEADAATALAQPGANPAVIDSIRRNRLAQLDPLGEVQAASEFERRRRETAVLAEDALARSEAQFNRMLPDIQAAYATTEQTLAGLEQAVSSQVQRTIAEAGAPLLGQAAAVANVLARGRTPAERDAAQQLLSAVESGNPEQAAASISALSGSFPLELGGAKDSADALIKEAAALRAVAARQLQQEGSSLRSELARIRSDARYRVAPGRRTMADVAEGGAAPVKTAASADPLAIVDSPRAAAAVSVGDGAVSAVPSVSTEATSPGVRAVLDARNEVPASLRLIQFAEEQAAAARAEIPAFYAENATGETNQAALLDRLRGLVRPFTQEVVVRTRPDGTREQVELPENLIARAMTFPEGSPERAALLAEAEVARLKISRAADPRRGVIPVPSTNRPAMAGFAV